MYRPSEYDDVAKIKRFLDLLLMRDDPALEEAAREARDGLDSIILGRWGE